MIKTFPDKFARRKYDSWFFNIKCFQLHQYGKAIFSLHPSMKDKEPETSNSDHLSQFFQLITPFGQDNYLASFLPSCFYIFKYYQIPFSVCCQEIEDTLDT
ncbi:MAG: hypothetical protein A2004_08840 [Spirochaetes bacterium GWC1_61_12]|nr:MAG: hypothetical protein A2004_08840 [Spirochaetes bacterium GWC1_61_12]